MSLDSRRFYVSGLQFDVDECHNQLMVHFSQFGNLSCQMFTTASSSQISNSTNGFLKIEEPLKENKLLDAQTNRGYAIVCFTDEGGANACANFDGPHNLRNGCELKIQRIADMTKSSLSHRLPSHRIYVSFMGVRAVSELALKTTFGEFGTITKIAFVGNEPGDSCSRDLEMAYIEFLEAEAVEKSMLQNHCVGGHRVKVRRGLKSEDLKKLLQKEREREHREQWIRERTEETQTDGIRDQQCHGYYESEKYAKQPYSQYKAYGNYSMVTPGFPINRDPSQQAGYAASVEYGYGYSKDTYESVYGAPATVWPMSSRPSGSSDATESETGKMLLPVYGYNNAV